MPTLRLEVLRILRQDGDRSKAAVRLHGPQSEDGEDLPEGIFTAFGALGPLLKGDIVSASGRLSTDPNFGPTFFVDIAPLVEIEQGSRGIVSVLKRLDHIGEYRANKLVEAYGPEELISILDRGEAGALTVVDGITPERAEVIVKGWAADKDYRRLYGLAVEWKLKQEHIESLLESFASEALAREESAAALALACLERDPFELYFRDVLGWEDAKEVAIRSGISASDPRFRASAVIYVLRLNESEGNTYLDISSLPG